MKYKAAIDILENEVLRLRGILKGSQNLVGYKIMTEETCEYLDTCQREQIECERAIDLLRGVMVRTKKISGGWSYSKEQAKLGNIDYSKMAKRAVAEQIAKILVDEKLMLWQEEESPSGNIACVGMVYILL
jgi:hypothetical protein